VFQGSRSISVFKSHYDVSRAAPKVELRFASDIVVKPSDSRSLVYGAFSKHEDDPIEVEIEAPSVGHSLITFTVLDDGKWVPLQHIEQIRSRNRVKLAEEDVKIPFFMDFRSIDQEKQKLLEELKGKANEQSKIIKHGK
jgi:U3 small nucleolar RNA-associated protein 21